MSLLPPHEVRHVDEIPLESSEGLSQHGLAHDATGLIAKTLDRHLKMLSLDSGLMKCNTEGSGPRPATGGILVFLR